MLPSVASPRPTSARSGRHEKATTHLRSGWRDHGGRYRPASRRFTGPRSCREHGQIQSSTVRRSVGTRGWCFFVFFFFFFPLYIFNNYYNHYYLRTVRPATPRPSSEKRQRQPDGAFPRLRPVAQRRQPSGRLPGDRRHGLPRGRLEFIRGLRKHNSCFMQNTTLGCSRSPPPGRNSEQAAWSCYCDPSEEQDAPRSSPDTDHRTMCSQTVASQR